MATFTYRCVDNHVVEIVFSLSERKDAIKCPVCGKKAKQQFSRVNIPAAKCFESIESEALSVHPTEVENARAEAKALGVGVDYAPDGTATFRGSREKQKLMKHLGFHYKDSVKGKTL